MTNENWRPIPGFVGFYEVSDLGRARSLNRTVTFEDGRVRFFGGRLLKLKMGPNGYPVVLLSRGMQNKKWHLLHRLVLLAFVGKVPKGMEACHNNGRRTDARLANLRYDTRSANHRDKHKHGTALVGVKHPWAYYRSSKLKPILKSEGTISEIAAAHGVSRTHVWNIRNGKRRPDVTGVFA
jgi:hypothetical protein